MAYQEFTTPQLRCDTVADLPANGSFVGQFAYTEDTDSVYAWDGAAWIIIGGGGFGAPTNADYLVKTANAGLSAERVVTDTATISWDWSTVGQAKANFIGSVSGGDGLNPFLLMGG